MMEKEEQDALSSSEEKEGEDSTETADRERNTSPLKRKVNLLLELSTKKKARKRSNEKKEVNASSTHQAKSEISSDEELDSIITIEQRKFEEIDCDEDEARNQTGVQDWELFYVKIGSWERRESDMRSFRWILRNEYTNNPEITIQMKGLSQYELGKKLIFRRLEIDHIKLAKKGKQLRVTFDLSCPPLFERFMALPGQKTNKWVRASDFTGGQAIIHRMLKLHTTTEAFKELMTKCASWVKPLLVKSLHQRPRLYFHGAHMVAPSSTVTNTIAASASTGRETSSKINIFPIFSLPEEVLMQILSYMEPKYLLRTISQVNHDFHNLANDELLWKRLFRLFCKSLAYPVEEASWDELPPHFTSWREAYSTTNAMCFYRCTYCGKRIMNGLTGRLLGCIICEFCEQLPFCPKTISRTQASVFGVKDQELVNSSLRRATKFNMHMVVSRYFIVNDVLEYARHRSSTIKPTPAGRLSDSQKGQDE